MQERHCWYGRYSDRKMSVKHSHVLLEDLDMIHMVLGDI